MDYVHYTWVREHVQQRLDEFSEAIGELTGTATKEERLAMQQHVAEQTAMVRTLLGLEVKKLEALIADQRQLIDAQARTIKTLQARSAKPKRETEYTPTMLPRGGSQPRRLS